ncbi:MAG: response regulator, partial [Anaerolineae bacterium]|nr:response regulator [Anaerolineae bacterium]
MSQEKILAIDDSEAILSLLRDKVLPQAGYEPLTARNGRDGLALALTAQPDLILLDLELPDISGLEIMRLWQSKGLKAPVIMMTGHGSEHVAVEALRLGVRDYIVKPFTAEEILDSVARALTESRLRRDKENLTAALQRRVQQLSVLHSAGKAVASLLDLDALLRLIVKLSISITGAEEGQLALQEGENGTLYIRAAKNLGHKEIRRLRLKARGDTFEQVLKTGKPLRIGADEENGLVRTGYMARALLQVPIRIKDRNIGVLSVDNQVQRRDFTQEDEEMLSALADHAAVAIENARLYEALRTSEQRYRSAIESSPEALAMIGHAYRFTFANKEFARLTGYAHDELIGMDFRKLIAPEQVPMMEDYYLRRQRGETVSHRNQVTILTAQGIRKDLEMDTSVWWDENGQASMHLFLREPSTHLMQDRFTSLLAAFRDADRGMCLLDNRGYIEWANPAMLALADSPPSAMIGHPLSDVLVLVGGEKTLITALEDAARGKDAHIVFTQPDREVRPTAIQLTCLARREEESFFLGIVRTIVSANLVYCRMAATRDI